MIFPTGEHPVSTRSLWGERNRQFKSEYLIPQMITDPANLEIEKLREPFANDGEACSKPVRDKRRENYALSDFGNLEKRLCDESYYRLKGLG